MAEAAAAFHSKSYPLAVEIYERRITTDTNVDMLVCYGSSLARAGRLADALDILAHANRVAGRVLSLDKLRHVTAVLLDAAVAAGRRQPVGSTELACPSCQAVPITPVTARCGHTYCQACLPGVDEPCLRCGATPERGSSPDSTNVLVQRLVEKWWPSAVQAAKIRSEADELLLTDQVEAAIGKYELALQCDPTDHVSLSNRSQAQLRAIRNEDALADANEAVRLRPWWGEGHLRRSQALAALGRLEEALDALCVSVALEGTIPGHVRTQTSRLLQRIVAMASGSPILPPIIKSSCGLSLAPETSYTGRIRSRSTHLIRPYVLPLSLNRSRYKSGRNSSDSEEELSSGGEEDLTTKFKNSKLQTLVARIIGHLESLKRPETSCQLPPPSSSLIDHSDMECILCYRTLWWPVTTRCGHTYCLYCLDRCLDYVLSCPLCMTSLTGYISINDKAVTEFIELALRLYLPHEYSSALQMYHVQIAEDRLIHSEIPIFVCTTAFPGVACPLFAFEPRYRLMVRRCVQTGSRQFGIATTLNKDPREYADYGTMLEIRDWVLLNDGSSILTTVGTRRFRVVHRGELDGYARARVEFFIDQPPEISGDQLKILHDRVLTIGLSWFDRASPSVQAEITRTLGQMPAPEQDWPNLPDGPAWTWWLLAILPIGQNLRVSFLKTKYLEKRLRAIEKVIEYLGNRQIKENF